MRRCTALLLVSLLSSGCLAALTGERNDDAPPFSLIDIDGRPLNLTDYRGQVLILDLMATWCGPCRAEMTHLATINETYGGRNVSILSVGIDGGESDRQLEVFRGAYGGTWRFARDTDGVSEKYRLGIIPKMIIIDPEGRIRFTNAGETYPATIARVINKIQGADTGGPAGLELAWSAAFLVFGAAAILAPHSWTRWRSGIRAARPNLLDEGPAGLRPAIVARYAPVAIIALALYAALGFLLFEFSRPITGRVSNVAVALGLFSLAAGILGLRKLVWPDVRLRQPGDAGDPPKPAKPLYDDWRGWARANMAFLYNGFPLFTTVIVAMLTATSLATAVLYSVAYGVGAAVVVLFTLNWVRLEKPAGLRAAGMAACIVFAVNGAYLIGRWFAT